jgi:hypothetical protein
MWFETDWVLIDQLSDVFKKHIARTLWRITAPDFQQSNSIVTRMDLTTMQPESMSKKPES